MQAVLASARKSTGKAAMACSASGGSCTSFVQLQNGLCVGLQKATSSTNFRSAIRARTPQQPRSGDLVLSPSRPRVGTVLQHAMRKSCTPSTPTMSRNLSCTTVTSSVSVTKAGDGRTNVRCFFTAKSRPWPSTCASTLWRTKSTTSTRINIFDSLSEKGSSRSSSRIFTPASQVDYSFFRNSDSRLLCTRSKSACFAATSVSAPPIAARTSPASSGSSSTVAPPALAAASSGGAAAAPGAALAAAQVGRREGMRIAINSAELLQQAGEIKTLACSSKDEGIKNLETNSTELPLQRAGRGTFASTHSHITPAEKSASCATSSTVAAALDIVHGTTYEGAPTASSTSRNLPAVADSIAKLLDFKLLYELSKGKLTVWVCLSALPGYFLAALPGELTVLNLASLFVGTALCSTASQTANQILEIDLDKKMNRTKNRVLVRNAISVPEAQLLTVASLSAGCGILALQHGPLASLVAASTFASYAFVYTPMKQLSPYNTHVGAIAGALPTCIGFAAAAGGTTAAAAAATTAAATTLPALVLANPWLPHCLYLFGFQTLWQMPHFYALAWLYREDYLKAEKFKMFCINDETGKETAAKFIQPWLVSIFAYPMLGYYLDLVPAMFVLSTTGSTAVWLRSFRTFRSNPSKKTCRSFFKMSLLHLLTVLLFFQFFCCVPKEKEEAVLVQQLADLRAAGKMKNDSVQELAQVGDEAEETSATPTDTDSSSEATVYGLQMDDNCGERNRANRQTNDDTTTCASSNVPSSTNKLQLNGFHAVRFYIREKFCIHEWIHSLPDFCPKFLA
ncbi:unnamed protein product [Amoebophrya sp. A120]|nr:unnamed protein product [Amoebophrya sp. A120]|eukprot:GSA120T00022216001.1